jgi:hypothetical protein
MEGYPVAKNPAKPARAYRRHGQLPAYFQWRDGRPTWNPSEGLRKAGWKRCDLRDDRGQYLTMGAAIDRAALINDAVALWRDGLSVPIIHASIAPAGATAERPIIRRGEDPLSIGALFDEWAGVKAPFKGGARTVLTKPACEDFAALRPATQRDYRNKLKRLIDVLAGYPVLPPADAAEAVRAYEQAVVDVRAESIFTLQADEDEDGITDPLKQAYRILRKNAGPNMAAGVLTVAGVWLSWARENKTRRIHNWASEVKRTGVSGRIRVLSWPELSHLIATAEAMGYPSIADAIVLGVDLSWSQIDRIDLTWDRVTTDDNGRLRALTRSQITDGPSAERVGRTKTSRVGGTPFLSIGRDRIAMIKARQEKMAAHPTHVLWCETTAAPWKSDHYRHTFAEIRARAAETMPSLGGKDGVKDQDLRDTGITICRQAGLTIDATCARSLQSRRRVLDLWDQAYGEIGPEIADAGADQLDAWMTEKRIAL